MTTPPPGSGDHDQPPGDQPGQPGQPWQQGEQGGQGWQQGWQGDQGWQGGPQGQPGWQPAGTPPYVYAAPDHPKAVTAMVLGIIGLVACQVASPFAWAMGKRTVAEIDASGGRLGGRGQAQAGYILGIVGTILLGLAVAFLLVYLVIMIAVFGGMAASNA